MEEAQTVEPLAGPAPQGREQMNIVVIGHVDHGKSTIIGRLLADTGSLPQGRLEQVREQCRRNARPFEYAFLLDALKDEQAQGITIDSARCFFRSAKREYILIDAPGHIEFLKNMISGAARAEAGLLVIDAKEGVRENSRRHGYMMSMLGVRQMAVCVNKMDLVDYDQAVFEAIRVEYSEFLGHVGIEPKDFIAVSGREGDNVASPSPRTPWYTGPSVLGMLDSFEKAPTRTDKPLRMPVQDIYKFTAVGDDRRIIAGRIETGTVRVGDKVVFLPSGKRSHVASIEEFNAPASDQAVAGQSTGVTLTEQIYIRSGEMMCKGGQPPARSSTRLRVNLFWISPQPMVKGKRYQMKLAGTRTAAWLTEVVTVLDASKLTTEVNKDRVERHDVAECVIETLKPVACDPVSEIPQTGRLVIIDNYEIAGGGVVLEAEVATDTLVQKHVQHREQAWDRTRITSGMRGGRYGQRSALVLLCGPVGVGKIDLAKAVEEYLFNNGRMVYYLGVSNALLGIDADLAASGQREEYLRRLGEVSHLFTDAGLILITTVSDLDDYELRMIDTLNQPNELLVVSVGENQLSRRQPDLHIEKVTDNVDALRGIHELIQAMNYLMEYHL
jgi:bifunctional enzyme CysN/CysC